MVDFRLIFSGTSKTYIKRKDLLNRKSLQVLWLPSLAGLPSQHPSLFQTLSSLAVEQPLTHEGRRKILEPSSGTLKHLNIAIVPQEDVSINPLRLPSLQVLELEELSEIQLLFLLGWEQINSNCPCLRVLRLSGPELLGGAELLLALQARDKSRKAGLEIDGMKIEPLKRLVINFEGYKPEQLKQSRELVAGVVDWDEEPEDWEDHS